MKNDVLFVLAILLSPCEHVWVPDYIINGPMISIPAMVGYNPPKVEICPICKAKKVTTVTSTESIKYY